MKGQKERQKKEIYAKWNISKLKPVIWSSVKKLGLSLDTMCRLFFTNKISKILNLFDTFKHQAELTKHSLKPWRPY